MVNESAGNILLDGALQDSLGSYYINNGVYIYDPNINEWTQIEPFPGTARGYGYGVYDNNIAFCGFGSDNFGYPTDWWRFDMNNEQWTQLASFPGT